MQASRLTLTGQDEDRKDIAIIVELKQWSRRWTVQQGWYRINVLGGAICETPHPSYPGVVIRDAPGDFNEAVYEGDVQIRQCRYVHNCRDESALNNVAIQ